MKREFELLAMAENARRDLYGDNVTEVLKGYGEDEPYTIRNEDTIRERWRRQCELAMLWDRTIP
jgi:hypothetical protein